MNSFVGIQHKKVPEASLCEAFLRKSKVTKLAICNVKFKNGWNLIVLLNHQRAINVPCTCNPFQVSLSLKFHIYERCFWVGITEFYSSFWSQCLAYFDRIPHVNCKYKQWAKLLNQHQYRRWGQLCPTYFTGWKYTRNLV